MMPSRLNARRAGAGLAGVLLLSVLVGYAAIGQEAQKPPVAQKAPPDKAAVPPKSADPGGTDPAGDKSRPAREPGVLEVHFTDESILHLKLRDENVELITPYGRLSIPVGDIEKVEVGLRVPADMAKRIEAAVANLGSSVVRAREAASAELLALKEKAYPALLRASKHPDDEVAHRAEEILEKLRDAVSEDRLTAREHDVIFTKDSAIAGRLAATTLRVTTAQFGEQQMKLADVVSIRVPGATEAKPDAKNVLADPGTLTPFQGQVGQTFAFRVTGAVGGQIWGTDVYTTDTTLATAAVHAGLLRVGQTGIVKVTIVGQQAAFQGSARNGVASAAYGAHLAYRIHK